MSVIPTKDDSGKPNGYVIPLWSALEHPEHRPEQVYLTAIAPHSRKGPHLHKKRIGRFYCIKGTVRLVVRYKETESMSGYYTEPLTPGLSYVVPTGFAAALYNDTDEEAILINMPSPAWSPDDQDEWPVENWED